MNLLLLNILVLIYLLITLYLGYRGWKSTKDSEGYLVAGRKTHPYIMAMSYGATFISTSAIVGFGGTAGLFGMGLLWLTLPQYLCGNLSGFHSLWQTYQEDRSQPKCHDLSGALRKAI